MHRMLVGPTMRLSQPQAGFAARLGLSFYLNKINGVKYVRTIPRI